MTGGYSRRIGPFSATMLVVGGIIGSGIFSEPHYASPLLGIARGHERWLAAGAIALRSLVNAAGVAVGTALVPVLSSYGGWEQANFVAEEMIEAERNLPRALVARSRHASTRPWRATGSSSRPSPRCNPRTRTPVRAIVLQGTWAVVLLASGSYGALLDWVTFADWIFFGLTAATLLVFRRRDLRDARPGYRAPWPRLTVAVFVLASAYVVAGAV